MRVPLSSLSKPVRYLLTLTFVAVFACVTFQFMSSRFYSISSISELKNIFSGIVLPPGAIQVGDVSVSSKITMQTVYGTFRTDLSGEQIEDFFRAQLKSTGWRQFERRSKDSKNIVVKFCRDGVTLGVEASYSPQVKSRFFLFVNRGFQPAFSNACK